MRYGSNSNKNVQIYVEIFVTTDDGAMQTGWLPFGAKDKLLTLSLSRVDIWSQKSSKKQLYVRYFSQYNTKDMITPIKFLLTISFVLKGTLIGKKETSTINKNNY